MAKLYMSCPIASVERARRVGEDLQKEGHQLVSSWHKEGGIVPESTGAELGVTIRERADACEYEIMEADVLVALTDAHHGTDTYVEIGIAQGGRIPVVWSLQGGGKATLAAARDGVVLVKSDALLPQAIAMVLKGGGGSLRQTRMAFDDVEGTS